MCDCFNCLHESEQLCEYTWATPASTTKTPSQALPSKHRASYLGTRSRRNPLLSCSKRFHGTCEKKLKLSRSMEARWNWNWSSSTSFLHCSRNFLRRKLAELKNGKFVRSEAELLALMLPPDPKRKNGVKECLSKGVPWSSCSSDRGKSAYRNSWTLNNKRRGTSFKISLHLPTYEARQ